MGSTKAAALKGSWRAAEVWHCLADQSPHREAGTAPGEAGEAPGEGGEAPGEGAASAAVETQGY